MMIRQMSQHRAKQGRGLGQAADVPKRWLATMYTATILACAGLGNSYAAPVQELDSSASAKSPAASKAGAEFNLDLLKEGSGLSKEDIASLLNLDNENEVTPGTYQVDVILNGSLLGKRPVVFGQVAGTKEVVACVDKAMLRLLGIDLKALKQTPEALESQSCFDLPKLINQASVRYDAGTLRLAFSIPQASLIAGSSGGYVDPALWEQGVPAAYVNYNINSYYSRSNSSYSSKSFYIGMNNGVNFAGWRLRNDANLSIDDNNQRTFRSNRTYIERDIDSLRSQLSIGDQYTNSTLFDGVRIRGLNLASDDAMLPSNEIGYAPVIRGQAATAATVEVRQNNYIIHKENVAPGAFALRNITGSGANGDLEITVIEADGSKHVSYQSFSSLPIMLRKERFKYALSVGQYLDASNSYNKPKVATASAVYGVWDNATLAGGFAFSSNYQAFNLGFGGNTWLGAVSMDITHAVSKVNADSRSGQSIRLLYAKGFDATGTTFTLSSYRYSTEGYRGLSEHIAESNNSKLQGINSISMDGRVRSRFTLSANQTLGAESKYGSMFIDLSQENYWNANGSSRSLAAGYSHRFGPVSYNLSVSQSRSSTSSGSAKSTQVQLGFSFALGSGSRAPSVSSTASYSKDAGSQLQSSLSGSLTGNSAYSISAGYSGQSKEGSLGLGVSSSNSIASYSGNYNYTKQSQSLSGSLSGALVLHGGGLNFGRTVDNSFAILESKGIKDSKLQVQGGGSFGSNGYAIMPNLSPYRVNTIALDTRHVSSGVELEDAIQQVVPRRGAIVKAVYRGYMGRRVLFSLKDTDGNAIPFGALVKDEQGQTLGFADPNSRALLLLKSDKGQIDISWKDHQCKAAYTLPMADPKLNYQKMDLQCQATEKER